MSFLQESPRHPYSRVQFRIVDGQEIFDAYQDPSVPSSLVGHQSVRWYVENPQTVKMLQAVEVDTQGEMQRRLGRALVWVTMAGDVVMDTVYIAKGYDYLSARFQQEAHARGFENAGIWFAYDMERVPEHAVRMKIPTREFDRWPYLDTFCYMEIETQNTVVLRSRPRRSTEFCLRSHEGIFLLYPQEEEALMNSLEIIFANVQAQKMTFMEIMRLYDEWTMTESLRDDMFNTKLDMHGTFLVQETDHVVPTA